MKLAIGSDDAGLDMKGMLKAYAESFGHELVDYGVHDTSPCLYPDIAHAVATAVAAGKHERGILICGTGIGMAISANKVPGIRAALAHDAFSAERAVKSNNAQVLTLGARVIGPELAKYILRVFLESTFVDGPSTPKVQRIMEYEKSYRAGAV